MPPVTRISVIEMEYVNFSFDKGYFSENGHVSRRQKAEERSGRVEGQKGRRQSAVGSNQCSVFSLSFSNQTLSSVISA